MAFSLYFTLQIYAIVFTIYLCLGYTAFKPVKGIIINNLPKSMKTMNRTREKDSNITENVTNIHFNTHTENLAFDFLVNKSKNGGLLIDNEFKKETVNTTVDKFDNLLDVSINMNYGGDISDNKDDSDSMALGFGSFGNSSFKRTHEISKRVYEKKENIKDIWCYCNLPKCVPNGYLCQSKEIGICFSKKVAKEKIIPKWWNVTLFSSHGMSRELFVRGCAEFLSESDKLECNYKIDPDPISLPVLLPQNTTSNLIGTKSNKTSSQSPEQSRSVRFTSSVASEDMSNIDLVCCTQNVCNFEMAQTISSVKLDKNEPVILSETSWIHNATIVVCISGAVIMMILFVCASKMLADDRKIQRENQFQTSFGKEVYIKIPYYLENGRINTQSEYNSGVPDKCSVLCAKSLQKKQYVAEYCRSHYPPSNLYRHSSSCPSFLSSHSPMVSTCQSPLLQFPRESTDTFIFKQISSPLSPVKTSQSSCHSQTNMRLKIPVSAFTTDEQRCAPSLVTNVSDKS